MLCDDPLVAELRARGYNVIRYPTAAYRPLLVLESDRRREVHVLGDLESELPSDEAAPAVVAGAPAPDIGIDSTRTLSAKVAADVLQPFLTALGVAPAVTATVSRTSAATIAMTGVTRDGVAVGDLARYLEGPVRSGSDHVGAAAARDRLFVVTSVLRSATLLARIDTTIAREVAAAAPVAGAVTVSLGAADATTRSCELSFVGSTPLAFAFQAVQVLYEGGLYVDFATARGLAGFELSEGDGTLPLGSLLMEDALVDVAL